MSACFDNTIYNHSVYPQYKESIQKWTRLLGPKVGLGPMGDK